MVLLAKDIMDPNVLTIDEGADALDCARRMVAARKGYAVVTRGGGALAGIVTEWDYLERVIATGRDPATVPVRAIASTDVQSCAPETPTDEVATQMATLGVRRLLVRSGDRVVGVITSRHVIAIFRQYIDRLSREIAGYQNPSPPLG
ncbi:MAG TPA: CBS domain-containing protein [Thermoplasmata archaeon]|nr:CBS domain-containing protein [Thermoplasmata archaeon]